jgi:hypothetical protein
MARFANFAAFYPFYLSQHQNLACRRLHFVGAIFALGFLLRAIYTLDLRFAALALISGYGFAWVGHFFFEHNRPATFSHPFYSFIGDWVMFKDILVGKLKF